MAKMTEEERCYHAFKIALGQYILEFKKINEDGSAIIDLDLNTDLLEDFFNAGWGWGKGEHHDPCPECPKPPICTACASSNCACSSK